MSKKQKIVTSVVVVLLVLIALVYFKKKSIKQALMPKLNVATVNLVNLSDEGINLEAKVIIDNPFPSGLKLDSLEYAIFINDKEVIKSMYQDSLHIEAGDNSSFMLPITILKKKANKILVDLKNAGVDSATYSLKGSAFLQSPLLPDNSFDFNLEKKLPLFQVVEVSVADIDLAKIGLEKVSVTVDLQIINQNKSNFDLTDLTFELQLGDNEVLQGHNKEPIPIEPEDTTRFPLAIQMDISESFESLFGLIEKGDDFSYDFQLNTTINSKNKAVNGGKIKVNAEGVISDFKQDN